jgi:hypothetical protein
MSSGDNLPGADAVLRLLDRRYLYESVLRRHDEAREHFRCESVTVGTPAQFQQAIIRYTAHHIGFVEGQEPDGLTAFSLADEALRETMRGSGTIRGYEAALAAGLGLSPGGMPDVFNALSRGFKAKYLRGHIDRAFSEVVNESSLDSCREIAEALVERYGTALSRLGIVVDETLVVLEPRRYLWSVRERLEHALVHLEIGGRQ